MVGVPRTEGGAVSQCPTQLCSAMTFSSGKCGDQKRRRAGRQSIRLRVVWVEMEGHVIGSTYTNTLGADDATTIAICNE